jgi:hypothetical protein
MHYDIFMTGVEEAVEIHPFDGVKVDEYYSLDSRSHQRFCHNGPDTPCTDDANSKTRQVCLNFFPPRRHGPPQSFFESRPWDQLICVRDG